MYWAHSKVFYTRKRKRIERYPHFFGLENGKIFKWDFCTSRYYIYVQFTTRYYRYICIVWMQSMIIRQTIGGTLFNVLCRYNVYLKSFPDSSQSPRVKGKPWNRVFRHNVLVCYMHSIIFYCDNSCINNKYNMYLIPIRWLRLLLRNYATIKIYNNYK